ncbi:MAG TPA: sigma-70 family RNA polymerase sigma factor [Candidatus Eremiobacteraceae bacterium]|nr:sigma-70 family RNA polymerase sigma factor [Candidatus Eremiobacteraceae bacterium]
MDAPNAEEDARYWLAQIARGDRSAFERLFRAYEVRLYRYLLSMMRDKQQAEELVNDVMVEVWRSAPRFRSESKPATWLFGIAYHKAIDGLRKRKAPSVELRAVAAVPDPRPNPEEVAVAEILRRNLEAAMASLSPEHRAVVELALTHGYSYQQISDIAGCPVNTVKTRMFHAKRHLREYFVRRGLHGEAS